MWTTQVTVWNDQGVVIATSENVKTLNRMKLLNYFHADNELLFVNVNHGLPKRKLNSNDQVKRQAIFNYLNELKNGLDRRQKRKPNR